ncbi:MAG TPA: cation:proton antiporter [Gemmatimonadaceae bacterium]|nr:cation:proton antiporter [Gemmatimonadaceae bacterium]
MRRVVVLVFLLAGMQLILPLGVPGHGSELLLTFGFLIIAAYSAGELAAAAGLPRIIGYLFSGVLFGPHVMGVAPAPVVHDLEPVSQLAIALIAFLAGAELRWPEVRARGRAILTITLSELLVDFVLLSALMAVIGSRLPFLQGDVRSTIAFGALFAAICIVHSPAVTLALLNETRAGGPVARTTLGVVLVSDVVVVLLFSAVLAVTRAAIPPQGAPGLGIGGTIWEILGAVVVGGLLGLAVAAYLRVASRELFLFAIVVAFIGVVIAGLTHVETLLTLLTAGFVTENVSHPEQGEAFRRAMERSAAPVFVVFFALAGAEIAVADLTRLWIFVVPIVLVRVAGIWLGTRVGARLASVPREGRLVWMGLVSQSGVAIGLAAVLAQAYPDRGDAVRTVFLAVVALNELVGPILFRAALGRAGELHAPPVDASAEEATA